MIIKITFNDNDFTQIIEEYLGECRSNGMTAISYIWNMLSERHEDYSIIREAFNDVERGRDALYNGDDKTYIDLLARCLLYYIEDKYDNDRYQYMKANLSIKSIKSLSCSDQNGEVVYFFPKHGKYVTM